MNSKDLATFNQAVQMAQNGQKQAAYEQLTALAWNSPNNSNILLWLAFTSPSLAEAQSSIERAALLEPHNSSLTSARSWLEGEKAKAPVVIPQAQFALHSAKPSQSNYYDLPAQPVSNQYYEPLLPSPAPQEFQNGSSIPDQPEPPHREAFQPLAAGRTTPVSGLVRLGERRLALGKTLLPVWALLLSGLLVLGVVGGLLLIISSNNKPGDAASLATPGLVKDSSKGISNRDGLQSYFKYIAYLTFKDATPTSEGERVTGRSKDDVLVVDLIGPKDKLGKTILVYNANPKQNSRVMGYLSSLIDLVTSSWARDEINMWVERSVQASLDTDEDIVKYRDNVKLTLHASQAANNLNFTIEWVK